MDTTISLAAGIFVPMTTGAAIMVLLFYREPLPMPLHLAFSYALGLGTLTIWMLLLGMAGVKFSLGAIGLPLLGFSCAVFIARLYRWKREPVGSGIFLSKHLLNNLSLFSVINATFYIILLLYIAHNLLFVFWRAMNVPISEWDAIATVAFKAKIFFYERSLPDLNLLPHRTYPLFVPFAQTWVALNLGYWSDQFVKIIFPCALLSYLIVFYHFLARWTNRRWGLLGCAILLSANFFIHHATLSYSDFFLMYFNSIAVILLLDWGRCHGRGTLVLAGIFAGLATFTKLEGTSFLLIYFILFATINFSRGAFGPKEKISNLFQFSLPSVGLCVLYHLYKFLHNATEDGTGIINKTGIDFSMAKMRLLPETIENFTNNLFFSGNWNIVWFLALLSCVHLANKWKDSLVRYVLASLILFFGLYAAVALGTVNYVWIAGKFHATTLSRIILHFYPLSVVLIILLNFPSDLSGIKTQVPGNR